MHVIIQKKTILVFVANELRMGLHANTIVQRKFVKLQGWMNQHLAEIAHSAVLIVSEIPVKIK